MKLFSTRKRNISAVAVAIVVAALGTAISYAYWSSTGTGTGSANTGTSTSFTVASLAPTGAPLTPGGPSQSVAFTVTNPGTGIQNLSSVVVTVANANGSEWTAVEDCSSLDYTIGTPVITYGQIAAGATVSGTVTITMNNLATTNQDGCRLATVPLYFAAS